jgi:hypothetical protein
MDIDHQVATPNPTEPVAPAVGRTPNLAPSKKVAAGGVAGALTVVLVWVINTFMLTNQAQQIPGEVASAITTIFSFAVAYFVPES